MMTRMIGCNTVMMEESAGFRLVVKERTGTDQHLGKRACALAYGDHLYDKGRK